MYVNQNVSSVLGSYDSAFGKLGGGGRKVVRLEVYVVYSSCPFNNL